ncbi:thioesterase II family protein [Salinispora sp. H7-4]|uniref:thioesterase II family protein n=1 Tax=Salinispora sp. H7-4 TaxID=2748321 RepID=UPI0015D34D0C|nr:alpha/beta fold hydrolase [Salinispora sp. H7-4]NYT94593.1 thioesterase [Salinispora sp. H7-4]
MTDTRRQARPEDWFRAYRRVVEPRIRLVCFPHAGGNAQLFHGWSALLPADVEVLAVRYPGRLDRLAEPCATDMTELADDITAALSWCPTRSVALFGHSMGSSVAYEVTLRLEAAGIPVRRLFVSAHAAPHQAQRTRLHELGDDALVAGVRRLGDLGSAAYDNAELRELLLPPLRADYALIEGYWPATPAPVRAAITAYVGDRDPGCTPERVRGWSDLTAPGRFELHSFPGDHFYLAPRQAELVSHITRRLS